MVRVEFHLDFGSPNAYLAHLVIPEIDRRNGVEFENVPIQLGGVIELTNNRSPAEGLAGTKSDSSSSFRPARSRPSSSPTRSVRSRAGPSEHRRSSSGTRSTSARIGCVTSRRGSSRSARKDRGAVDGIACRTRHSLPGAGPTPTPRNEGHEDTLL